MANDIKAAQMEFRIAHTDELIRMFREYLELMPEHAEYYMSIITHLEVIKQGYKQIAGMSNVTH